MSNTNASGVYQFTGLLPGDYIVRADASSFGAGCEQRRPAQSVGDDTESFRRRASNAADTDRNDIRHDADV